MENKNEISHDFFNERIKKENYNFANENVAMFGGRLFRAEGATDKFMDLWKGSVTHNFNMIDLRATSGAVNVVVDYDTKDYYSTMILVRE